MNHDCDVNNDNIEHDSDDDNSDDDSDDNDKKPIQNNTGTAIQWKKDLLKHWERITKIP